MKRVPCNGQWTIGNFDRACAFDTFGPKPHPVAAGAPAPLAPRRTARQTARNPAGDVVFPTMALPGSIPSFGDGFCKNEREASQLGEFPFS